MIVKHSQNNDDNTVIMNDFGNNTNGDSLILLFYSNELVLLTARVQQSQPEYLK